MSNENLREALRRATDLLKDGDALGASLALTEAEKQIDAITKPSLAWVEPSKEQITQVVEKHWDSKWAIASGVLKLSKDLNSHDH